MKIKYRRHIKIKMGSGNIAQRQLLKGWAGGWVSASLSVIVSKLGLSDGLGQRFPLCHRPCILEEKYHDELYRSATISSWHWRVVSKEIDHWRFGYVDDCIRSWCREAKWRISDKHREIGGTQFTMLKLTKAYALSSESLIRKKSYYSVCGVIPHTRRK